MADLMEDIYHVLVRRDPEDTRFWLAEVAGLPGAETSSRSLATLDRYVREVIVLAADLPDEVTDQLTLEWEYHTGYADVDAEAVRLRRLRAQLEASSQELAKDTAFVARKLVTDAGLSVREAATLLGISPARIDQLVQKPKARRDVPRRAA
jgi:hypothetical protein